MSTVKNSLIRMFHPRMVKERLIEYALRGKGVECVCCHSTYITFLPAGILRRANAKCPHCGSLERHRAMWLFLEQRKLLQGNNIKTFCT